MPTDYKDVEPAGFGRTPFGSPSDDDDQKEFGRGFGDPTTQYTDYTSD